MINKNELIPISSLFDGRCGLCARPVPTGSPVLWDRNEKKVYHHSCMGIVDRQPRTIELLSGARFKIKFEKQNFYLETMIRQVAGIFYDTQDASWIIEKANPVSARQLLDLAENQEFDYNSEVLMKLADTIREGTEALLRSMARTSSFKVEGLRNSPFGFQVSGIEFGINNKRVIIADQMGLGKTIQAMGIIAHLKLFPAVVVCPAILKLNWQREILAWMEDVSIEDVWVLERRSAHMLPPAKIYIVNYDILPNWLGQLLKKNLKIVVFDEFHYVKTSTSLRGKAAKSLAEDRDYVLGLTGTPILNRPEELVHPLRIIGKLREVGGKDYFEKRYCDAKRDQYGRWDTSGASNLKELNERLRASGILIRRTKTNVLPDLPPKLPPTVVPIELSNNAEYKKAEKNLARWLADKAIEDQQFKKSIAHLPAMDQLKKTTDRHRSVEYQARKNEERLGFIYLKRLSTQGKLHGIKDHVNNFLESGEKLLLFGWFVDTQLDLSQTWPWAAHVLGKDSDKQRAEAIDKFQNDPNCQMLIASLKVLGLGVNLTAASHVAFAELGWTPADHDQAEDRVHRIGQTMPVNVYYYVGINTIEEDIIDIIDSKRKVISAATDGVAFDDQEIIKLLIGRLLRKHIVK